MTTITIAFHSGQRKTTKRQNSSHNIKNEPPNHIKPNGRATPYQPLIANPSFLLVDSNDTAIRRIK